MIEFVPADMVTEVNTVVQPKEKKAPVAEVVDRLMVVAEATLEGLPVES